MRHSLGMALGAALLATACQSATDTSAAPAAETETQAAPQADTALSPSIANIEADMRFLADDALEGREAGTAGYDTAAAYVANRMAALGVAPAGVDGTYFQTVPLRRSYRAGDGMALAATHSETGDPLTLEDSFLCLYREIIICHLCRCFLFCRYNLLKSKTGPSASSVHFVSIRAFVLTIFPLCE